MLGEKAVAAKRDKTYLFRCLLLANFLQYLEAGAVPALLLQLSESFEMGPGKQGLLGGVVYLSLGVGGPFAGYLLRKYEHKTVISCAVAANMFFTVIWAFTPIGETYSTNMFIAVRFLMGLCQCVICVFLPLWTNENAPKETRTAWMSYLQASVPFGIMMGYIIASILTSISNKNNACFGLLCWRWSFLIEVMLLSPLYLGLYFIPKEDIAVCAGGSTRASTESPNENASQNTTVAVTESNKNSTENLLEVGRKVSPLSSQRQDFAPRRDVETGNFTYKSPERVASHEEGAPTSSRRRPHMTPEERQQCSTLRQTAMSASMYDPLSTRYAFKKSCDNIAFLDPSNGIFPALPGLRWADDEDLASAPPASTAHSSSNRAIQSPTATAAQAGHASHHKSAKSSRRSSPRYRSLDEANTPLEEVGASEKGQTLSNKTNSTEEDSRDTKLDTKGKRKPLASGNRVRTSLMLDANGQVVHSSSRRDRDRDRERGGSRRESSSALRGGGSRRLSLQEWILGSLPALPAMPYTRSAEEEEEAQGLLGDPLSSASYGSVHGTEDPLGRTDNRVRRSLDYSFKRSSKAPDPTNRRSSTSAAVGSSSSSKRSSGDFEPKSLPRKPKADTVQYESFRELTRQNTFSNNNRSSWGVFSMLGYNRDRSRSNSGNTGSELPILVPFSKSDRSGRQDGLSPKRAQGSATSPADKHTRSYSSGDIDVDFSRFDELETPPPHALHRTRSRTMSNPAAADPSALFSRSTEERERERDRLNRFGKISESEAGDSTKSGYVDAEDLAERGESKEEEEGEMVDEYESEEEDNYSASYDDMSYSDSDTESDEEWPGLTPPPPLRSASQSTYHSSHQRAASRDFESPPSSASAARHRAEQGTTSASKGTARRTPGTAGGTSSPLGSTSQVAEEEAEGGVLERTSRFISRAQRYLKSAYDTVCALLSIKTYRYLLGAMSALYFTVTGVQFWGTKYLTVALHAPLPLVSTLFILCAATGPTLGVFFGGWVVDRLGGYKGAHQRVVALELCATFGVLAFVFSLPLTFLNNIFAVVGLLWVVLLFGGAMLPACSGIVVSIIPRAYRPTSSSLALMVFNMFGYFMSLLLSGMLMQVLEEHRDVCDEVCALTWGFRLVLFWSVISLFFLLKALGASYQHLKDRDRGRSLRRRGSNRYSLRQDQA